MNTNKGKKNRKQEGKKFEEDFAESFKKLDIFIYRLRDSAGAWSGSGNNGQRFTSKNICDFFASIHKGVLLMELKSTKSKTSIPLANLTKNQVIQMFRASEYSHVCSYFIFNFRTIEQTFAISSEKVYDFYMHGDRKSFSLEFCKRNGILIPQQIKKSRYTYDLDYFINEI